jgi:tetratricopeptide (TPR) repeat protein
MSGEYREAVELFDQASTASPELGLRFAETIQTARQTRDALATMSEMVSPDGRFVLRYFKEDRLLMPYLLEVLVAADQALSEDFQYQPPGRVVVEIYPRAEYLAQVSSLTEEDIETSGTIALCKYNRLMFTSPRGLVRGYGWRDTVTHEFVHYYVTKYSANTVPIWLHEGIAKFEEIRWRSAPMRHLAPPQEDLLARSLEAGQLITFDQMHPSMAKLPSQEAASLAFAEVHLVIDFLYQRGGYPQLRVLLQSLKSGASMDEALSEAYGLSLRGVWDEWLKAMHAEDFKRYPGLVQRSLKFKRPGQEGEPEAEYDSIENKEVKDHAHLGELLRARGRNYAALREYRRAEKQGGDGHLTVQNGIASTLLELGTPEEIPQTLKRVRSYYPTFLTTHLNLGRAFLAMNQPRRAIESLEAAVGINPFHPIPHQLLYELYQKTGDSTRADRTREALKILGASTR